MSNQQYRPSQIIMSYGPGSILETPNGPVLARSMQDFFRNIGRDPFDFEILDERLTDGELSGGRIFRIASNAELEVEDDSAIYPTFTFPTWSICTRHVPQVIYRRRDGCPDCRDMKEFDRAQKAGREAIRFVLACKAGHLSDVDWRGLVHGASNCDSQVYRWHGGGRSLRYIEIECVRCNARANFGAAYQRKNWHCLGKFPERNSTAAGCTEGAQIVQRNAANLRLPDMVSALTIVSVPSRLHKLINAHPVILQTAKTLRKQGKLTQPDLLSLVEGEIPPGSLEQLREMSWPYLLNAMEQLLDLKAAQGKSLLQGEFEAFQAAATEGIGSKDLAALPGQPPIFEINPNKVRVLNRALPLRIVPVERLRMVHVQTSYRRVIATDPQVVDVSYSVNGQTWFPGVALSGEGIFIDSNGQPLALSGNRFNHWMSMYSASGDSNLHPAAVWWHTLAHRLIRAMSVESGYSSASIRERVYLHLDGTSPALGGVLLYTVQPGGDGTLGGLLALAAKVEQLIDQALADIDSCSNDPICEDNSPTVSLGSACYACLFASETSCEKRNLWLDRILLAENQPK